MIQLYERIGQILKGLKPLDYKNRVEISTLEFADGNFLTPEAGKEAQWSSFESGTSWGGREVHAAFKSEITIPNEFGSKHIAIKISTASTGWDALNPQMLFYLNGKLVQGVDVNHTEIFLGNSHKAGDILDVYIHAYGGRLRGKCIFKMELVEIDMNVRKLYYDIKTPYLALERMEQNSKDYLDIVRALNETINKIDLRMLPVFPTDTQALKLVDYSDVRRTFTPEFDASVKEALEYIDENFYRVICDSTRQIIATCVGHTHIDVAWLWTVEQSREKTLRSFSTVLKLMEDYPEYVFMSSQAQLYDFVKDRSPELFERIKKAIKGGRWEAEGAMWVEPDCNVISGESLVRQLLVGKNFFNDEFGLENEILWLPDVFGYSAALPQILKKSDVNYFMTTKISWNQFNKCPYDTFMWKGIDGTEILSHFITATGPKQDISKRYMTTYNGELEPGTVTGAWERYQQKFLNDDVLISYGFGDGGGGPTYEMLEYGKRMEKGIPNVPVVKQGTSYDYFTRLEEKIEDDKYLPKWAGELYLELHRGTYTSMAANKRDNRLCEILFTDAEKLSVMAKDLGGEYEYEKMYEAWKNILCNQFHDILPGSSVKDVYDVTDAEYKEHKQLAKSIIETSARFIMEKVNAKKNEIFAFNTTSFNRKGYISIDKYSTECLSSLKADEVAVLCDKVGNEFIARLDGGSNVRFYDNEITPLGYKVYTLKEIKNNTVKSTIIASADALENDYLIIRFNEKGQIISYVDKEANREVVKTNGLMNVLRAYENLPSEHENWEIDIFYREKFWEIDNLVSAKILENNGVLAVLELTYKYMQSTIIQKVIMYADTKRVDFKTYVDWKEPQILLRTESDVDINSTKATYEIQYGNIERSTTDNTSWDMGQFEVVGHKWADLSDNGFGVALLNDSKYGYRIKDGNMGLSLIKGGIYPNPVADICEHEFTYSFFTHETDDLSRVIEEGYNLNYPLYTMENKADGTGASDFSYISVDKENVIVEVVKKAEKSDYTIIRLYESMNKLTDVSISLGRKDVKEVVLCNLMEKDIESMPLVEGKLLLRIKPFEIVTLKVK